MNFDKSWIQLSYESPQIEVDDQTNVQFPIELPKYFIEKLTKPGDTVFDPFAGFGTTLLAAQELGRIGVGVEYEEKRADHVQTQIKEPSHVIHGDSRELDKMDLPQFDLCFTSPPYMRSFDEENPLSNYHESGNYENYLKGINEIFQQIKGRMKPGTYVLVEAENTYEPGVPMTPLVWDLGRELSKIFFLEREMICCFKEGDLKTRKVNHSTILVFKNI
ncbi:DNA methylase [Candidatus Peregrinibacteria bacterium]|nr:MAG: DNA methylase [Candidatus Peregrinibacteria bacterium]